MPRGDIGGWATSHETVFNQYKRYLSYVKACNGVSGCYGQQKFYYPSAGEDSSWGDNAFPKLVRRHLTYFCTQE